MMVDQQGVPKGLRQVLEEHGVDANGMVRKHLTTSSTSTLLS